PIGDRGQGHTLFETLDETKTAMGRRLLRDWLARPLMDLEPLQARQHAVGAFFEDASARMATREALSGVPDLERLTNRVRSYAASPRDIKGLGRGLNALPGLVEKLPEAGDAVTRVAGTAPTCQDPSALIDAALMDDPPMTAGEGGVIRHGFDPELDELRSLLSEAQSHLAGLEKQAREDTGIKTLKVGYNKVFGYYIEVSRPNLGSVPEEWERRQTLVGGERFITPSLKEYEAKILNARDRISELERSAFRRVCGELNAYSEQIMAAARTVANIDALSALAEAAAREGWVRPELDDGDAIEITSGRHPVVERALGAGRFVPNDTRMSSSGEQLVIITGPNMAGKSTYIRQVAVLTLMAQAGSFVPADQARFGVVDRIFTRTGLADDIAGGQSTFMVEMVETASILRQATPRSLIVLDEIGRGTSTYDGMSIARAVAEHIHNSPRLGCKALFATHYHEMTALADSLPRAVNYQVSVSEEDGEIVFLHRIVPGGADSSYGVHVGQLAGLPAAVVARAWELLQEWESGSDGPRKRANPPAAAQLPLLASGSRVEEELRALDVENMTPLQAINSLYRLRGLAEGSDGRQAG
ncbi:MAG: DNA mismatch repair protein MutS, partial [Chloroflexota bacterium]